jgi:hypothetical protein
MRLSSGSRRLTQSLSKTWTLFPSPWQLRQPAACIRATKAARVLPSRGWHNRRRSSSRCRGTIRWSRSRPSADPARCASGPRGAPHAPRPTVPPTVRPRTRGLAAGKSATTTARCRSCNRSRDPVGFQLRLAAVRQIFVADAEVLGPAAGQVHTAGNSFRAAVALHAMLVEYGWTMLGKSTYPLPQDSGCSLRGSRLSRSGSGAWATVVAALGSWQPMHERVVPGAACTNVLMLCTSRPSASRA